jgi:hypothetical protein
MKKTMIFTVVAVLVAFAMSASAVPLVLEDFHMSKAKGLLNEARSEVQKATSVNAPGQKAAAIQAINAALNHLHQAEKKDYKKDQKHDKKHPYEPAA